MVYKKIDIDTITRTQIEIIKTTLTKNQLPLVVPSWQLLEFTKDALFIAMQDLAIYVWPTSELVHYLDSMFPDKSNVIEIGSGNGVLAYALGIRATDNYSQCDQFRPKSPAEKAAHKRALQTFKALKMAHVNYGPNVENISAINAIKKYKPMHVLGCYVTHIWREGMLNGNELGIDEEKIISDPSINSYTVVGNSVTHKDKPILKHPHETMRPHGIIARAFDQKQNCVFRWLD